MMAKLQLAMKNWAHVLNPTLIIFGFLYIPWSIKTEIAILKVNQLQMQETLKYGKEQRELLTREVRENIVMDIERLRIADRQCEAWQTNLMALFSKTCEGMERLQKTLDGHIAQSK